MDASKHRTAGLPLVALLTLVSLSVLAASLPAAAEDAPGERPKLTENPLKDAKPGEFLRYMEADGGWKKYFVERIIDVRDGEVLWEIYQTTPDGSKDLSPVRTGWLKVPEFKPRAHQKIISDKMEELEVNGKTLWCRHLLIEQQQNPPFPDPKIRRDVWYSNDIPCSGKVKEDTRGRIALEWGMLPKEVVEARKRFYEPKPEDEE